MNPYEKYKRPPALPLNMRETPPIDDVGVTPMSESDVYEAVGGNPYEKYAKAPQPTEQLRPKEPIQEIARLSSPKQYGPPEAPNFFERVGADFQKRDENLQKASENPDFFGGEAGLMYNAIGQNFQKYLSDVPGEAIVSAGKAIPQPLKDYGSRVYSNFKGGTFGPLINAPIDAAGYVLGQAAEGYDKFKRNNPTAGLYADSTLGYGNAALAALPVKGESLPSRAIGAGQELVDDAAKPVAKFAEQNLIKHAPDISSDSVRQIGGDLMSKAGKSGAVIHPQAATGFIDDVVNKVQPKGVWAKAANIRTEVDDIVENMAALRGQAMSLEDAMELESTIGKLAYSPKNYSMGKFTPEGSQLLKIKNSLSDMVDNAADAGLVTGDANAIAAWREGQKYWAASVRARKLENIIENAGYMDSPAKSIQVGMKNLIKNKNEFSKYSKAEQALIRQAATTGVVTDFYRIGASGLGPLAAGAVGGAVGMAVGGPLGAAVGTVSSAAASNVGREASKAIATSRQMARANKAYKAVAAESVGLPTKSLTMKQIMALPPDQAKLYLKNLKK